MVDTWDGASLSVVTVISKAQGIVHEAVDVESLRESTLLQSLDGGFDPCDRVLLMVLVRDRNERGAEIRDEVVADHFADHDHSNHVLAVIWVHLLLSEFPGLLGSTVNLICHVLERPVGDVVDIAVSTGVFSLGEIRTAQWYAA